MSWIPFIGRHFKRPLSVRERLARNDATLTKLSLEYDRQPQHRFGMRDAQVGELTEACRYNTHLQELNLANNMIGPLGAHLLAETLTRKTFALTRLDLSDNLDIGDDGLARLAQALESTNSRLQYLSLVNCEVGPNGAKSLAKMLPLNDSLKVLNLCINPIGDVGATALLEGLMENCALEELRISQCLIGDHTRRAIRKLLCSSESNLKVLNLAYNSITDDGVVELARGLEHTKTLTTLVLSANQIQSRGAEALGCALRTNKNLRHLNLRGNNIGKNGVRHLAKDLRHNTTLVSLALNQNSNTESVSFDQAEINTILNTNRKLQRFGARFDSLPPSVKPFLLARANHAMIFSVLRENNASLLQTKIKGNT